MRRQLRVWAWCLFFLCVVGPCDLRTMGPRGAAEPANLGATSAQKDALDKATAEFGTPPRGAPRLLGCDRFARAPRRAAGVRDPDLRGAEEDRACSGR